MIGDGRFRVLALGGTGMIGRPVVRAMVAHGFDVRVLTRDASRAIPGLAQGVELVEGDLADPGAVAGAFAGVDAVTLTLNTPFSERAGFDPDLHGTLSAIELASRAGVRRIVRLSALGVPEGRHGWWVIERKAQADEATLRASVPGVVLRADWFMETLAALRIGPALFVPGAPSTGLRWIAGEDFGRMVVSALTADDAVGRAFDVQGPESVSFRDAASRFAGACSRSLACVPVPRAALRIAGLAMAKPRYLDEVLRHTYTHGVGDRGRVATRLLGEPAMRIEDYARSIARTGDWPAK